MITSTIQKIILTILITLPTLAFAGGFEGFHIDVGFGKKYNDKKNFSGGVLHKIGLLCFPEFNQ